VNVVFRAMRSDDWPTIKCHLDLHLVEDTKGIMVEDAATGDFLGAAIFDHWMGNSVQVHQIILHPMILRHGFLEEVSKYVYLTGGRGIMYGLIPESNEKALKLDKHIGFTEIGRMPDAVRPGEGVVVMEMRKEDCRYLKGLH